MLKENGSRVSLFIEPDPVQLIAAKRMGADITEFHTGRYVELSLAGESELASAELERIADCAKRAVDLGVEPQAGHGLTYDTVQPVAAIPELTELNIGHFLMGEAIFVGLIPAIQHMRQLMDEARS
jgi:pyridoxine 5-phosphate synthase